MLGGDLCGLLIAHCSLLVVQDLFSVSVVLIAVALSAQNDLLERENSTQIPLSFYGRVQFCSLQRLTVCQQWTR